MIRAYLLFNAVMYVVFAIVCAIWPEKTANFVGFAFKSGSGRSEYVAVYGGLEMAMGLFFLVAGVSEKWQHAGLLFAVLLYACLVLFRAPTLVLVSGIERQTFILAAAELVLGVIAAILWFRRGG
ncbi:MAG: DUF4345 family protein [Phycisphaerales bacterium]